MYNVHLKYIINIIYMYAYETSMVQKIVEHKKIIIKYMYHNEITVHSIIITLHVYIHVHVCMCTP